MKSYQSPQPFGVERINKNQKTQSNLAGSKHKKNNDPNLNKSNKEIFVTESEEQAWRDALKEDKAP